MNDLANIPAWLEGLPRWQPLERLQGKESADVCVVGLGGSGLAAVTRLLELGRTVVGVDAGPVAAAAAGRNGGLLLAGTAAFHHDAERVLGADEALRWFADTQAEIDRMLLETPGLARRSGSLRIAADAAELDDCRAQFEAMRSAGLPVKEYSGPEGEGLLFPQDACFNPPARHRELALRAIAAGARLYENSRVTALSGKRVETEAGSIDCAAVIVAVDGNLALLLPELAGDVKPLRLQMLATEPDPVNIPRPVYYRHGFEYWQQLADGRVLLGGFRDRGGPGEWGAEPVPGEAVQQQLERFLRDHLGVRSRISHRWAATVGYRDQLLPVFAEVRDSVWAVGGYNGTGNVVGSLLARRAAERVTAAG